MRTIKASEVVKGMRVEAESATHNVTVRIEGDVCEARTINNEQVALTFEDGTQRFYPGDHPVTVLAEPEPEWVEGAWYWVNHRAVMENRVMRRVTSGWSISSSHDLADYSDSEVTVLGRVLIVDWPGDDVAQAIERDMLPDSEYSSPPNVLLAKVADAIRTQGGAP